MFMAADPRSLDELITDQVGRAIDGDRAGQEWLVDHFQPVLSLAGTYRLGRSLYLARELEEIMIDVWMRAIDRLEALKQPNPEPEIRPTNALLRFLAERVFEHAREIGKRRVTTRTTSAFRTTTSRRPALSQDDSPAAARRTQVAASVQRNLRTAANLAIDRLAPEDQEILVLRGLEQHPYAHIAAMLDVDAAHLPMRYTRTLRALRAKAPGSVFDLFQDA